MAGNRSRAPPPTHSLSFSDLKLTPNSVSALTAHLRTFPLLGTVPEARVRAAAIALITFGGSSDGRNYVHRGDPTPNSAPYDVRATSTFSDWQDELGDECMRTVMDLLTCRDWASGGVSFLISTSGTVCPGTLPTITEVEMDVFLPIVLFHDQPQARTVFARMVQHFAEEIGLPALQRLAKGKSSKSPRVLATTASAAPRLDTQPLVPESSTPWHTFYGRGVGVFERLIAEQTVVTGAIPQIPSVIPRPLPLRALEGFTSAAQSSSVPHSGKAKQAESKSWTVYDVRHYAERFEACGDDASRRAILQQVSTRLPELFGAVADLTRRVDELETIKQNQSSEIKLLRQTLQDSSNRRHVELTRIMAELTTSSVAEPTQRSSVRFDGDTSMPRLGRSGSSKTGSPTVSSVTNPSPLPSMYIAPRGERDIIPTPLVPVAPPPSHRSTLDSTTGHTPPPGRPRVGGSEGGTLGGKMFGPSTDALLAYRGLPRRMHTVLRDVERNFPEELWARTLHQRLASHLDDVAQELANAMKADGQLTTHPQQ